MYMSNYDVDSHSLFIEGGCPVIKGSKWSSTKWMHARKYRVRGR